MGGVPIGADRDNPSYAGRNDEHVRMLGHRREGRIRIFEHEFSVGVLLPGGQHGLLLGRELVHWKQRQRRIERLRRAAARVAQRLLAGPADPALPSRGRVQAQRQAERRGGGPAARVLQ